MYSRSHIKLWASLALIVVIVCVVAGAWIHERRKQEAYNSSLTIILSPHFDDAALSLGGLMARHDHPIVVATFFTAAPAVATTTPWDTASGFKNSTDAVAARSIENEQSLKPFGATIKNFGYIDNGYGRTESDSDLEVSLAQDIQSLLSTYKGKHIDIYGPAIFNADITHPDHGLLHKAFLDVQDGYPDPNVSFYIYEDFPYAGRFMRESVISLEKNLENDSNKYFDKVDIPLTNAEVNKKIKAVAAYKSQIPAFTAVGENILSDVETYTSTRCGTDPAVACEVVYRFH